MPSEESPGKSGRPLRAIFEHAPAVHRNCHMVINYRDAGGEDNRKLRGNDEE